MPGTVKCAPVCDMEQMCVICTINLCSMHILNHIKNGEVSYAASDHLKEYGQEGPSPCHTFTQSLNLESTVTLIYIHAYTHIFQVTYFLIKKTVISKNRLFCFVNTFLAL